MTQYPRSDLALKLREEGLSRAEVAQQMNTNVGNVDALCCQARKRRDRERLKAVVLAHVIGANV